MNWIDPLLGTRESSPFATMIPVSVIPILIATLPAAAGDKEVTQTDNLGTQRFWGAPWDKAGLLNASS
jgi:hypothetical protein